MIQFIKKYPLSLLVIAAILFLSLFNPPKTKLDPIEGIDKIVHLCMYGGLELVIWIEYLRHHDNLNWVKILFLGILAPIALGGIMEDIEAGKLDFSTADEDIHMGVEAELTRNNHSLLQVLKGFVAR